MNIRAISTSLVLAVALVAGSALAQQPRGIAKLTDVEGNVLVSQRDAMVAGANGQRLAVGTRVVTTAGAKATIDYDVGCDIVLKENERFTVRVGECPVLLTEVVPLGPAVGAIGGGAGAVAGGAFGNLTATNAILGAAGIAAVGFGAYEVFRNKSVSPN